MDSSPAVAVKIQVVDALSRSFSSRFLFFSRRYVLQTASNPNSFAFHTVWHAQIGLSRQRFNLYFKLWQHQQQGKPHQVHLLYRTSICIIEGVIWVHFVYVF